MVPSKVDRTISLILAAICLICCAHLLLGLAWTSESGSRGGPGLRPRRASVVQVRGRNYHVHLGEPVDLQHRKLLDVRLRNNQLAKPHFISRRRILSDGTAASSDYLGRDHEDLFPNVTCNTCSLVGYSGHLLGKQQGSTIDSSDCVIRLGRAPSIGYDADVGKKSTFRVLDATTLYDLLKKPSRLIDGPLASKHIVVFGTPAAHLRGDTPNSNAGLAVRLGRLRGHVSVFYLKRRAEHDAADALATAAAKLGYKLSGTQPSALWYAIKISSDVGCGSLKVYGVPDPRFCKRSKEETSRSRFWDFSSADQCTDGLDAGFVQNPVEVDSSHLSLSDRKALRGWLTEHSAHFFAPPWPRGKKQ
ncbi:alpha-N-acetylgalactosaminide alpha-2,6-sialyltransferase 5-like [Ornithodoros turicata]|uniref:alpha-N-acetylgalactosaminide alpha-2,6-sialyltransferase 5-like n=1 Tax=Ornithodoros turicata TaxID=34597 RepID=UPI003139A6B0